MQPRDCYWKVRNAIAENTDRRWQKRGESVDLGADSRAGVLENIRNLAKLDANVVDADIEHSLERCGWRIINRGSDYWFLD